VTFGGGPSQSAAGLEGLTIHGADTCVEVAGGTTGVRLGHVIVRDCRVEGVAVRANGGADVVNGTLVGNAIAVRAAGAVGMRNSILMSNGVAAANEASGTFASTYNDLFNNQTDYLGTTAGTGDISTAITFADLTARSLLLKTSQASTDRGDPADPVGDEPVPNGGRINLGAFGGTADAELTTPSTAIGGGALPGATPGSDPSPVGTGPTLTPTPNPGADDGGCRVAGRWDGGWAALIAVGVCALISRRRRRRDPLK
jgi:hypothetical protein